MKTRHKVILSIATFIIVILLIAPPIGKRYFINNSEKLIGRKVDIGKLYINYLKLAVNIKDFTMYEADKTNSFVSFDQLYVNYDFPPLLGGKYALSELKLVKPLVNIKQDSLGFNFSDLISSDSTKVKDPADTIKKELRFSVKNIQLVDGEIKYENQDINNSIDLNNLNLNVPIIAWDNSNSNVGVDFNVGDAGNVNIMAALNNMDNYDVALKTTDIDLGLSTSYLKKILNMNSLEGDLSTNLKIKGSIKNFMDLQVSGIVDVEDFKLTDTYGLPLLAFDTWITSVRDIDMSKYNFELAYSLLDGLSSSILLNEEGNNIQKLLVHLTSDTLSNDDVEDIADTTNIVVPTISWEADSVTLRNASINFTDSSLNRPFNYTIDQFNVYIDKVSSKSEAVPVNFSARINDKGTFTGSTLLNMTDILDMDLDISIKDVDLLSFSPYSEYYIASPITQGLFNLDLSLNMTPISLVNNNKIRIRGLNIGEKIKNETAIKLPVRLALYVIKDKNDNINIDLPIKGNPSSPSFSVKKLIINTLVNFITKTATEPFNLIGNVLGINPDRIKSLPYEYLQDTLNDEQKAILDELAQIATSKPELVFSLVQYVNSEAEIAAMGDIDQSVATANLNNLINKRNDAVLSYLLEVKQLPATSVKVSTADLRNIPEELKVPKFDVGVLLESE